MNEGYSRLASAVIDAAICDRHKVLRKLSLNPDNRDALKELEDIDSFFMGDDLEFYCSICDTNPEFIREKLKESDNDKQGIPFTSVSSPKKNRREEKKARYA